MNNLVITHEINRVKMRTDISVSNMPVIIKYWAMNYLSLRCVYSE